MRLLYTTVMAALAAFVEPGSASPLRLPSLGFVYDGGARGVRPIVGTPGAAVLGDPLAVGFPIATAAIARNYALVLSADDGRLRLVELGGEGVVVRMLEDTLPAAERIVLSPTGAAAVLYNASAGRLQVITGLPNAPMMSREVPTAELGDGTVNPAVSDDGQAVLFLAGGRVWLLGPDGGRAELALDASASVSFRPNSHEAVAVSRTGEIHLIARGGGISKFGLVVGAPDDPSGVQLSGDGTRAYVAYANGVVSIFNSVTGIVKHVSCGCRATGLHGVNAPSMFRINDASSAPVMLIDDSNEEPRLWFIPPGVAFTQESAR